MEDFSSSGLVEILKPAAADPDLDDTTRRNFKNMATNHRAFFQKLVDAGQNGETDGVLGVYVHSNSEDASTTDKLMAEGFSAVYSPKALASHEVLPDNMFGNVIVVKVKEFKPGVRSGDDKTVDEDFAAKMENLRGDNKIFNRVQETTPEGIPARKILLRTAENRHLTCDKCVWTAQLGTANSWIGLFRRHSKKSKSIRKYAIIAHVVHPGIGKEFKAWLSSLPNPTVGEVANSNTHRMFKNLAYRNAARIVYNFAELAGLSVRSQEDPLAYLEDARMDRPRLAVPHFHTEYSFFQKHTLDDMPVVLFMNKTSYLGPDTGGHTIMLSPLEGVLVYNIKDRLKHNKHSLSIENNLVAYTAPVCMGRKKNKWDVLADGAAEKISEMSVSKKVKKSMVWAKPEDRHAGSRAYDTSYKELTPKKLDMFGQVLALPDKYHQYKPYKVRVTLAEYH